MTKLSIACKENKDGDSSRLGKYTSFQKKRNKNEAIKSCKMEVPSRFHQIGKQKKTAEAKQNYKINTLNKDLSI